MGGYKGHLKKEIFERQEGKCFYCGHPCLIDVKLKHKDKFTLDHVVPRSKGGKHERSNIVGACKICNGLKANLTEAEFRLTYLYKKA